MNTSDPIADMLTRIRNASAARHKDLTLPSSKVKREIARILTEEGFIESWETATEGVQEMLSRAPEVRRGPHAGGVRASSASASQACASTRARPRFPRVLGGLGLAILSTSRGIMTGSQARKLNLGGEVLCYVW